MGCVAHASWRGTWTAGAAAQEKAPEGKAGGTQLLAASRVLAASGSQEAASA